MGQDLHVVWFQALSALDHGLGMFPEVGTPIRTIVIFAWTLSLQRN